MLSLCLKSLRNRRFIAVLTVASIALSVALILGVERLRTQARAGFANSASGVDLIVAARGNDVQILLATVFGVGSTGAGISWDSYEMVSELPAVDWTVPILMGDNHRGYPVIGTSAEYFDRFQHSGGQALIFHSGAAFARESEAVVGAEVAAAFGYTPGVEIINAHGSGEVAFEVHDEAPFTVAGVLEQTGTSVDRMVFVSLQGFDALHATPTSHASDPFAQQPDTAQPARDGQAQGPATINAVFAGLKNKTAILSIQRHISQYRDEALSAVLPYIALLQLWSITGTAEVALRLMAGAVALAGMIGMVVMLSAALDARRREFAILRSVGATPQSIFGLIVLEAVLLLLSGIALGYLVLTLFTLAANPVLASNFGLRLSAGLPTYREALLIALVFCSGLAASAIPALRVYKMTLADGLSMRL